MRVPMMDIGEVRMEVRQFSVMMNMRVRFTRWIARLVVMLMMLVMPMKMFVRHCFMTMHVSVTFGKMQPDSD
jgi:hypothetical protein